MGHFDLDAKRVVDFDSTRAKRIADYHTVPVAARTVRTAANGQAGLAEPTADTAGMAADTV